MDRVARDHAYGLLFRPDDAGHDQDTIMEEGRPLPDDIGAVLAQARTLLAQFQQTTDRVVAALVPDST
jgi:hypothetical protein